MKKRLQQLRFRAACKAQHEDAFRLVGTAK